jgi:Glutaminase
MSESEFESPMDAEFLNVAKLSSSGSSDEESFVPGNAEISEANKATLLSWLEDEDGTFGSFTWPVSVTQKVHARLEVLREGLVPKVNGIYSIWLAKDIADYWAAAGVCPEMLEAASSHLEELQEAHPDRPVGDHDMAFLWSACNIGELPITANGEQDCEYRAHAICELINSEDAVIGARYLAKVWLVSTTQNLGPGQKWFHHVAPIVFLTNGEKRVFDPLLCPGGPCPESNWLKALKNSGGALRSVEAWERLGKPEPDNPLSRVSDWATMIGASERSKIDQAKEIK